MSTITPITSRRTAWIAAGAGLAAAAAIVTAITVGSPEPSTTVLTAPPADDPFASCAVIDAESIAAADTAFRATVTSIDGDVVTMRVDERFAGDVSDTVSLMQSDPDDVMYGAPAAYIEGTTYLVSALDGQVRTCGLSGEASPELTALYDAAFE